MDGTLYIFLPLQHTGHIGGNTFSKTFYKKYLSSDDKGKVNIDIFSNFVAHSENLELSAWPNFTYVMPFRKT